MSGITHKWNGTILTVTSDSGTSSADLKGEKGDTGIRGAQGAEGKVDTSKVYTIEKPPTAADVGAVPKTRIINNHILDKDINLTAADVGAAPSGYGLGIESQMLTAKDDLNNIKANGWYRWYMNDAPANAPVEYAWSDFQACRVWTLDGGVCLQEIVELGYNSQVAGVKAQRTIYGNIAKPWEVVNPPMILGVEYRTTKRHQGKPVWTAVINCGSMPAAGTEEVSIAWLNASHILSCNGYMVDVGGNDSYNLPFNGYTVAARYHKIYKSADYDASMYNCYLTLEYTKTTD